MRQSDALQILIAKEKCAKILMPYTHNIIELMCCSGLRIKKKWK
jgi:hypothetical protein